MALDASVIASIHGLMRNGSYQIPADSGMGDVQRPSAKSQWGGRVAGPEQLFDFYINDIPDPDEAYAANPNIEFQIRTHPMIQAAFRKREFTVGQMPRRIERNPAAPDAHYATVVADHCADVIRAIPNFSQCIEMMQNGVLAGGQGIEFDWHRDANGVEYPVSWHGVHKTRFAFDRLGNMALLTRDQAVWGAYVAMNPQRQHQNFKGPLPQGKFVYYIYRQGQGPWYSPALEGYAYYGIGEDVALYYVLMMDIFCLKYRMKFLEVYGMPQRRLYTANNMLTTRDMQRIADSCRGESLVVIPFVPFNGVTGGGTDVNNLFKVEDVPVPGGSFDYFNQHIMGYTLPMINSVLLGFDAPGAGSGGQGGYSQKIAALDSGPNIIFKRDAQNIGACLTTQLMPAIALGRFPNLPKEYFPVFSLEPREERDKIQELEVIKKAQECGLQVTEAHAYDVADLPMPRKGEKLLQPPNPGGQFPPGNLPGGNIPGRPPIMNSSRPEDADPAFPKVAKGRAMVGANGQTRNMTGLG